MLLILCWRLQYRLQSTKMILVFTFLFFSFKQTGLFSKSSSNVTTFSCSFTSTLECICQPKTTTSCTYRFLQNSSWSDQAPGHPKKKSPLNLSCSIACSAHAVTCTKLQTSYCKGLILPKAPESSYKSPAVQPHACRIQLFFIWGTSLLWSNVLIEYLSSPKLINEWKYCFSTHLSGIDLSWTFCDSLLSSEHNQRQHKSSTTPFPQAHGVVRCTTCPPK